MNRTTRWLLPTVLVIASALPILALATDGYTLIWWTVDGGGQMFSTGGAYTLGGAVGQSDAGALTGGEYTLNGGFWGGVEVQYTNYLPLILRNGP